MMAQGTVTPQRSGTPVPSSSTPTFQWNCESETLFLQSFFGKNNTVLRPVGPHKHLYMLIAYAKFSNALYALYKEKERAPPLPPFIDIEHCWNKLEELYDLDKLDEDVRNSERSSGRSTANLFFPRGEVKEFNLPQEWIQDRNNKKRSSTAAQDEASIKRLRRK